MNPKWSSRMGLIGVLIMLQGCQRARVQDSKIYARLSQIERDHSEHRIDELAIGGAVAVVTECGKTSFANVRTGLMAGETKLHEDIFEMRDRISFRVVPYGLNETLQLEEMLDAEASAGGHSEQQARCMRSFAEHLESLTDPIVEGDKVQKEIDLSAFNRATKESEGKNSGSSRAYHYRIHLLRPRSSYCSRLSSERRRRMRSTA